MGAKGKDAVIRARREAFSEKLIKDGAAQISYGNRLDQARVIMKQLVADWLGDDWKSGKLGAEYRAGQLIGKDGEIDQAALDAVVNEARAGDELAIWTAALVENYCARQGLETPHIARGVAAYGLLNPPLQVKGRANNATIRDKARRDSEIKWIVELVATSAQIQAVRERPAPYSAGELDAVDVFTEFFELDRKATLAAITRATRANS
jgi:hypothetical protein